MLQHGDDDLRLVLEALDEQRADRAVDEAGNQGFLLGRTAFALEIAAGDLARGEGLFLVVDGQREEVEARLGLFLEDHRGQDDGVAVGGQHRAVGLTGEAARLEGQLAAGPVDGFAFDIEHVFDLSLIPRTHFLRGRTGRFAFQGVFRWSSPTDGGLRISCEPSANE